MDERLKNMAREREKKKKECGRRGNKNDSMLVSSLDVKDRGTDTVNSHLN